jgi:phosphoribosylformylglycinamidine synthase
LISGKDSMKNESTMGGVKISVPPTLLVSAMGQIDDVQAAVTLEPQQAGDVVFLVGTTRDECGGSEYFRHLGDRDGADSPLGQPRPYVGRNVPTVDTDETLPLYRAIGRAQRDGIVQSATTPSRGGLGPALARCVMAAGLGLDLDLAGCPDIAGLRPDTALFSESNGRFLVTTRSEDADRFANFFEGLACRRIGTVVERARLLVRSGERSWVDLGVEELKPAFKERLSDE